MVQVTKDAIKEAAKIKWKSLGDQGQQSWDLKYQELAPQPSVA